MTKVVALWVPEDVAYIELGKLYEVIDVKNGYLGIINTGPCDDDIANIIIDGKTCAHLNAPWLIINE